MHNAMRDIEEFLPHSFVSRYHLMPLAETVDDRSISFLTDNEITADTISLLQFLLNKDQIVLEPLSSRPDLMQVFHDTLEWSAHMEENDPIQDLSFVASEPGDLE